jgi:hypothetical protein
MSQDNFNSQPPNSQSPQPFWKAKIIQFLRGTIGILEVTVDKLEAEPTGDHDSDPGGGWQGILSRIRSLLPAGLASQLSDAALSGAIALLAVVLIWGTSSTLFGSKPTEVATIPEVEPIATTIPTPSIPVEVEPAPPIVEDITVVEDTEKPIEEIPPTVAEDPPEPTPVFVPLTPEQSLIAAIESRISEVSDRTSSGIIKSTQANFATSTLLVKVSDEWYNLKPNDQNKLASQMFLRSQDLDFSHLEIVDILDRIVARNPVIGTEMIIFQRYLNQVEQG